MKLRELFNNTSATLYEADTPNGVVVIYAGRFHPFHKGHKAVFDSAVKVYGIEKCFIATSGKVEAPKSPFTFDEKVKMMCLNQLISQDFFQELRTQKQLGYLVGTGYAPLNGRGTSAAAMRSRMAEKRIKTREKPTAAPKP